MSVRNIEFFFKPRSIAIAGAGRESASLGHIILRNIIGSGFTGPIGVVHTTAANVAGIACARTPAGLSFVPDLAVIVTPPDAVAPLTDAFAKHGTKAVVVITAGFGEGADQTGLQRRKAMLDAAKPHTTRIIGPNCFGILAPGVNLNASFARTGAPQGHLALVAQSGAIAAAMIDWARPRQVGFSLIATLGDMADVDLGDMLDYLAGDQDTHAILMYIEGVTNARKFMSAARAAARIKPVIVVKSGRHEASGKAAASHTGAIAGSDAVYDAAFARAGLLRVDSLEGLFDAATVLAAPPQILGDRLAILTNGGGAGVLAVDALLDFGGRLAELAPGTVTGLNNCLPTTWSHGNPIDIIGDADARRYELALAEALADPGVDAVLAMLCPTAAADPTDVATRIVQTAQQSKKPVLTAWLGDESVKSARTVFATAKIPTFRSPRAAVEGFSQLIEWRRRREMLLETPASVPDIATENVRAAASIIHAAQGRGRAWLPTADAKKIIALYGIPTTRTIMAATRAEVEAAATALGSSVAIKIASPDVVHKSDVGGVVLGLTGPSEAGIAFDAMVARVRDKVPKARINGVTVEAMASRDGQHELFLGLTTDATFGPVIAFGHGGVAIEAINDRALGLPPLNSLLARRMIESTRIARLLRGYRHVPGVDLDAIGMIAVRLAQLALDHPAISDIDINPLLAGSNGLLALDGRIQVNDRPIAQPVIQPYPRALERNLALRDGTPVYIRPIRPDDEDALRAMVRKLDMRDARFRFFLPLRDLNHPIAARLTQIDYDREMAFVCAPPPGTSDFWSIARLHCDPDAIRGEYALLVRSDLQGRGLGWLMLTLIIGEAKRRGLRELWGDVLHDNTRMLTLVKEFGFKLSAVPGDATIVRTTLPLTA